MSRFLFYPIVSVRGQLHTYITHTHTHTHTHTGRQTCLLSSYRPRNPLPKTRGEGIYIFVFIFLFLSLFSSKRPRNPLPKTREEGMYISPIPSFLPGPWYTQPLTINLGEKRFFSLSVSSDGPPVQSFFTSQSLHNSFFLKKIRRSNRQRNFPPFFFAS
jgi:hypothetical protein